MITKDTLFMEDDAPSQTDKITQDLLDEDNVKKFAWSSKSKYMSVMSSEK